MRTRIVAGLVVAFGWLGLASPASAQVENADTTTLVVGEQTSVSATGVRNYSEGVPGVVDVRLTKDGADFIIVALRPGATTLLLIFNDGHKLQHTYKVVESRAEEGAVIERENIRLDFYFVEVSSSYGYQVGVGWPASLGGEGIFRISATVDLKASSNSSATAVVANQPLPRLDLLQTAGWAKISRQAALVTSNGDQATFSSGGEVNLAVQGALTAEIRKIEFGTNIHVLPRYDAKSGRIELQVSADVSDLTDDRGSGIPGRTVSKLDTVVNLEMGQGVMLAGLQAQTQSASRAGLPLLSRIPVLGWLFSTHTSRAEEVQNVLFIVPSVVDLVSASDRERIGEALKQFRDFEGELPDRSFIGEPPPRPAPHPTK